MNSYNNSGADILVPSHYFFEGGVDDDAIADGSGILGHILATKQNNVQNALNKKSGLDSGTISQILTIAAPL